MIVGAHEGYRAKYACSHYDNIGLDCQCFGLGWWGLVMVWAILQGCIGNSGTPGRIWRRGHAVYGYAHRGEWRGCRVVVTCARPFDDHCVVGRVPRQPRAGKPQNTPLVCRIDAPGFLRAGDFLVRYPLCAGCPRPSRRRRRRLHAAEVATAKGVTLKAVVAKRTEPSLG